MKPSALNGRLAMRLIFLSQYEKQFLPQKVIKGQVLADFLAKNLRRGVMKFYKDLSNEVNEVFAKQSTFNNRVYYIYFDEVL